MSVSEKNVIQIILRDAF